MKHRRKSTLLPQAKQRLKGQLHKSIRMRSENQAPNTYMESAQ